MINEPTPALLGRSGELHRLGAALSGARNRQASAIVIEGDPGIGKTALLDTFASTHRSFALRTVRLPGFSSEVDLPYAGLDRLILELPEEVASLPDTLRQALEVATGREAGDPPDRFHVGLAVLSALGAAEGLTLCLIDDAHLLDEASLAVLAFVGRRLKAESVLLLFGTRPYSAVLETLSGIEVLPLKGLDNLSAIALLNAHGAGGMDPHLAMKVVEQLGGHPLAITDLAEHADAERLALRALSIEPLPPGTLLEGFYQREIDALPTDSRAFALLAVTDTTGAIDVIQDAAVLLGLSEDAAAPLEGTRLIDISERVRFRHQLVRPAVYNAATSSQRRRAHLALAATSEKHGFAAAAATHAAAAAVGPDPVVAAQLQSLADAAAARGALLSRAGLLVRASELTPAGAARQERQLAAGEAALAAGAAVLARELLDALDPDAMSALDRGRYLSTRAFLAMFVGDPHGIPCVAATFVGAADAFRPASPELEQRALIDAFYYVLTTEWATEDLSVQELGERLLLGSRSADNDLATVLRGLSAHILLPYEEAAPLVREALAVARSADDDALMRLGLFGVPLAVALWEPRAAVDLAQRVIDRATGLGAMQALDTTQWTLSTVHVQLLDIAAAGRALENVRELRRAIGYPAEHVVNAAYLALSGVPLKVVDAAAASIRATGFGGAWTVVQAGIATRLLADGDYRGAYERLHPIVSGDFLHVAKMALPDFAEAAARSGHHEQARSAVDTMERLAAVTPALWLRGLVSRSRAILANAPSAEHDFVTAIELLSAAETPGDLARAHLLFGEWLRRRRRRREARVHLAEAVRTFDVLGAAPFATRARHEFAATGESMPPPVTDTDFTPRESLVVSLAAAGKTNQEIAAALFISPNTVDYHLRKVFRKLGITSRRQLIERNHD